MFSLVTFLIWNFFQLFRRTQNQHQISNSAFFDTHIAFLKEKIFRDQLDLFANLEVKRGKTGSQTTKNVHYKCDLKFNLATINSLGEPSLYPSVHS
jgi:hypothetical protein